MGFLIVFLGLGSREIVLANSLLLYIHFLLHHRGRAQLDFSSPEQRFWFHFLPKGSIFFVIAWNMLSSLLAHHPTHLPTLHFPRFTRSVEMRFIIVGSVSLTWQHVIRQQLLASFCCATFSYIPNSFLHILGRWLVKSHNSLFCVP